MSAMAIVLNVRMAKTVRIIRAKIHLTDANQGMSVVLDMNGPALLELTKSAVLLIHASPAQKESTVVKSASL